MFLNILHYRILNRDPFYALPSATGARGPGAKPNRRRPPILEKSKPALRQIFASFFLSLDAEWPMKVPASDIAPFSISQSAALYLTLEP